MKRNTSRSTVSACVSVRACEIVRVRVLRIHFACVARPRCEFRPALGAPQNFSSLWMCVYGLLGCVGVAFPAKPG
jgi:hypothetical protein